MRSAQWRIEESPAGSGATEPVAAAGVVSLAFMRATLRRLWYVWGACALGGVLLALAWLVLVPPQSVGTATLLLAHDPGTQPDAAMATDVKLLMTRTVAQEVIDQLGVDESPDDLLKSVLADPATPSVLQIDVRGTGPDDAVRRARTLADAYLSYRAEQLTLQAQGTTQGYRDRVATLQAQVDDLTRRYDLMISPSGGDEQAAELLSQRGVLLNQITGLQNQIESETLGAKAIVTASRIVDQASLVPQSARRRAVLVLASGLIGGLGLGLGLVLLYAVTTGRLRSRADVAAAMALPVLYSAGTVVPRWRRRGPRHAAALQLLVDGLVTAVPTRGKRPQRLALVTVDCEREGAAVVAALARRLEATKSVLAVDLAATGLFDRELHPSRAGADEVTTGSVGVVSGPATDAVADVLLCLVPFEVGRGLGHVKSQVPRCVVLVKAGRSTAERLSTVARAARAAGLDVAFVMLVGADRSDASFGGGVSADKAPAAR